MLAAGCALRVSQLRHSAQHACTIHGWHYTSHRVACIVAALCALVPWPQLSARMAQSTIPVAPFEYVGAVPWSQRAGLQASHV
jgi:hypothetical protein